LKEAQTETGVPNFRSESFFEQAKDFCLRSAAGARPFGDFQFVFNPSAISRQPSALSLAAFIRREAGVPPFPNRHSMLLCRLYSVMSCR
jgi:hypothetical protein